MVSPTPLLKAIRPLVLLGAALFASTAVAGDFEDMVAAERAFAADASARNTRDAFLAAYAEDGVAFAPGPRNAQRVWEKRSANKNHLEWAPEVAEIASSGELGYTSGAREDLGKYLQKLPNAEDADSVRNTLIDLGGSRALLN